jgi:uncharacterized membrane protein YgdD (TMEM256/DUF423 family)
MSGPEPMSANGRLAAAFGMVGAWLGFVGVAAGAFGTHTLRFMLAPPMLNAFETAVRYQLVHAVALVVVALVLERFGSTAFSAAGALFLAGCVLFCGSLYALALSGVRAWGIVTPFGGACFLAGWACLALGFATRRGGTT